MPFFTPFSHLYREILLSGLSTHELLAAIQGILQERFFIFSFLPNTLNFDIVAYYSSL